MQSRCALFVDAGYLFAAAADRVAGTSLRGAITVDHAALVDALIAQVESLSGLPLLRVNWYDAALSSGQPDRDQELIGMLARVKVRLGRRSVRGDQKGVDVRLGLDLVSHGQNRAAEVIYLLSGDDDLTEAVAEAQGHGVQVMVLAVPDQHGLAFGVARNLQREVDGVELIDPLTIESTVHRTARPSPQLPASVVEGALDDSAAGTTAGTTIGTAAGEPAPAPVLPVPCRPASEQPAASLELPGPSPAVPAAPTPAMLAGRPPKPGHPPAHPAPYRPEIRYSTTTGHAPISDSGVGPQELAEMIDTVCRSVLSTWQRTATEGDRRSLLLARPGIPRDIDRALLIDLANRLRIEDIDEQSRYTLRDHFWELVEAI